MDIRLRELELLTEIDRCGRLTVGPLAGSERDLAAFLVFNGYVNDFNVPWVHNDNFYPNSLPGESELERKLHTERMHSLSKVLGNRDVSLQVTHSGRVRMAELRQALRSGKLREQCGVLWDGRHFDTDLRIAVLEASRSTPVAIAYLDLNGFKVVNDTLGHDAGDIAIRAYFQNVSAALHDRGDAYRLGGDEVGAIIPSCSVEEATKIVRNVCMLVQHEHLQFNGQQLPPVSLAVGLVVSTSADAPESKRRAAEMLMYEAKKFTKELSPRRGSLKVYDQGTVQVFS